MCRFHAENRQSPLQAAQQALSRAGPACRSAGDCLNPPDPEDKEDSASSPPLFRGVRRDTMDASQLLNKAEELMAAERPEEAAAIYADLSAMDHLTDEERANSLFGLGTCEFLAGKPARAASSLQRAWEILYASLGMRHPFTARVMVMLSRALFAMGSLDTGMEVGRSALKTLEELYGKNHEQTATAAFFLAGGAQASERLAESEDLVRQAMDAWSELHGPKSLQVAMCLDALGVLRNLCGEQREGTDFHTAALEIKLALLGERLDTALACGAVGIAEATQENWSVASSRLAQALRILEQCEEKPEQDRATFLQYLEECRKHLSGGDNNA